MEIFLDGEEWYKTEDGDSECQCARCGCATFRVQCYCCFGELTEDIAMICNQCRGIGGWQQCFNSVEGCKNSPMHGRENVKGAGRQK